MFVKRLLTMLFLSALFALPANAALIINELDSDTVNPPSPAPADPDEFVELYETTGTSVSLNGYVLVYYNGNGNVVYRAEDLDTFSTSATGYFTAGNIAGATKNVPGNVLQNGVDGIALFLGNAADFPNGTAAAARPAGTTLIDAIVYKTGNDVDGVGLTTALSVSGAVVDEWGRDGLSTTGALDSIGRIPNGGGAVLDSAAWIYMTPTPNGPNSPPVPEPATVMLLVMAGSAVTLLRRRNAR